MAKKKRTTASGKKIPLIPVYARLPLLFCGITDLIVYYLPRLMNVRGRPQLFYIEKLDSAIPLIPAFAYIYLAAFVFWTINYIYISRQNRRLCIKLVFADTVAKAVCMYCFLKIPATITQPDLAQNTDLGAWLLRLIYSLDEPNNLLPSIHCFVSWLAVRPMLTKDAWDINKGYKVFSMIFALLICASTLFTKQHFAADVLTGIFVAEAGWQISRLLNVREL